MANNSKKVKHGLLIYLPRLFAKDFERESESLFSGNTFHCFLTRTWIRHPHTMKWWLKATLRMIPVLFVKALPNV